MNDSGLRARGLSRRDFLKAGGAGLAAAALLGVAGCSGGGGQQGGGGTRLVFTSAPDDTGTTLKLVQKFNEQNKGKYKVVFRQGSADTGQRFDQIRTQMQAGGGDLDVILGDVIWTAQLAASGWISDLSERFTDSDRQDFLPGSVEAIIYEGKAYGMPWFTDTGLLYYRKDLLEKSGYNGPPKTWDELKDMALKVKEDSGTKFGFVFQGAEYEGGVCDGCEFIWTHGGNILDPDDPSKVVVDSPQAAAGLATERSMIESGVSPQAVYSYKESEGDGVFLRGDTVFYRCWPYVYSLAGTSDFPDVKPEQVGVSELPSADGKPGNGTVGDQPFYISASSKNQDGAWELIKFMTDPEQQKFRAVEGSYLPTRTALYDDQGILQKVPVVGLAKEALQHTRPRPVSPYYSDMSLEMAEQFNISLKGEATPEETVRNLQRLLESLIEEGQES